MKIDKPKTTLFMLQSLDGKISTGDNDNRDVDKDFPSIEGLKEGLKQYYDLEQETDLHSLNTGRVMEKIGINERKDKPNRIPVSFIIIDNKPHLNKNGLKYLINLVEKLYLVTTNKSHPVFSLKDEDRLEIIHYKEEINFKDLFKKLSKEYNIKKLTIQSGGSMNSIFLREKLIDEISIVVAPCLIGGKNTSTLIDGISLNSKEDLKYIKTLELIKCNILKNSYIHLRYKVKN